jgi:hypothetical protein
MSVCCHAGDAARRQASRASPGFSAIATEAGRPLMRAQSQTQRARLWIPYKTACPPDLPTQRIYRTVTAHWMPQIATCGAARGDHELLRRARGHQEAGRSEGRQYRVQRAKGKQQVAAGARTGEQQHAAQDGPDERPQDSQRELRRGQQELGAGARLEPQQEEAEAAAERVREDRECDALLAQELRVVRAVASFSQRGARAQAWAQAWNRVRALIACPIAAALSGRAARCCNGRKTGGLPGSKRTGVPLRRRMSKAPRRQPPQAAAAGLSPRDASAVAALQLQLALVGFAPAARKRPHDHHDGPADARNAVEPRLQQRLSMRLHAATALQPACGASAAGCGCPAVAAARTTCRAWIPLCCSTCWRSTGGCRGTPTA